MNFKLPKIYAITDTRISGISHAEQVARLIDGGIELIQLRDKFASPREFYESAIPVMKIAKKSDVKIIINDRVDIALAVGADGVHLGQDDLSPEHARKILGPEAIIGCSTHSLEQARLTIELQVDYIAIGPVFSTATKEKPDTVVGLDTINLAKHAVGSIPLVAIGGINFGNLASVLAAGADSAALISALVSDADQIKEKAEILISQGNAAN